MRLIISEKNIAARRIAEILAVGKPSSDKVYTTPVYTFRRDGDDWVSIGLKGHIMKADFPKVIRKQKTGWWVGQIDSGPTMGFSLPAVLDEQHDVGDEVDLGRWNLKALPYLVHVPVGKLPAEKGIIQSIRSLAKKATEVVIATDFDREGELIGADARSVVRDVNVDVPVHRVRFSAITKGEIERAFAEVGEVSDALAQAGESRQDIDLVWGAALTRFLTLANQSKSRKPFGDVISAGRVQTPTLKLIVDREKERDVFVPEDYWTVKGAFGSGDASFTAGHGTDRFKAEADALAVMDAVEGAETGKVVETKRTRRKVDPPAPFNTTSLMAAAANEGVAPARTMQVAESLYMSGLISYPRVDNTVYPPSLDLKALLTTLCEVAEYREHAKRLLGGTLTPTRGPKETTDHPPIHPTGAGDPDKLDGQAWKIYNLVARRFLATLSGPAYVEATRVDIDVNGERFVAKGDVVSEPGFRAVYHYGLKKDEHLPPLAEGDSAVFGGATMEAKQTQPASRYSQGKLIQEMERLGLGTKATRHDIIQTLYDRKYVVNDPAEPTCKGRAVIGALERYADRITTPGMTSDLEVDMDAIADGSTGRDEVVDRSRSLLGPVIDALLSEVSAVCEALEVAALDDAKVGRCPACGNDLVIKFSPKTKSHFVGCSGYPECAVTYPLPKNAKYSAVEDVCPVCGTPQVLVIQFRKRPRNMCLSPDCPTKKGPEIELGPCPKCDGGVFWVRYSAVGSRYARCTNSEGKKCQDPFKPLPQNGEIQATGETCPCGYPVVVVHTKKGPWRICIDPDCPTKAAKPKRTVRATKPKAKAKPKK